MKLFGRKGLFHPTLNISPYYASLPKITKQQLVLNLGGGKERLASHIINADIQKYKGIDVVCDAHILPFRDACFDYVFMIALLEHVPYPLRIVKECYRVLKNGGYIYIEFPFMQGFHPAPNDYWRVTKSGIRLLIRDFSEIDCGISVGPGSSVTWLLSEYFPLFFKNKKISHLIRIIVLIVLSPLKYLDKYLAFREGSEKIASAFYIISLKRAKNWVSVKK